MTNQSLQFLFYRLKQPELTREQNEAKVCQEIFLCKLGSDEQLSSRVAIKGGIIIDYLSNKQRGFTKDIDFDFIKFPLSPDGIKAFIDRLNSTPCYKNIAISIDTIEELRHKNYSGKRVKLLFCDNISSFSLIVDIGVYLPLFSRNKKIEYEMAFGGKTHLTINSIERIIAEKLSTFAIYGVDNSRTKDFFDAYFFIKRFKFDSTQVVKILNSLLVKRENYYKSLDLAIVEIENTLNDKTYRLSLEKSDRNWLGVNVGAAITEMNEFLTQIRKHSYKK